MDAKQAALNEIGQKLNPAMGYETGYGDAVRQAELEAGSTQQQDQSQANLVMSGVDGETAEAAASVLTQEAIDSSEQRSFAEQHVVMEAYVQLQQAEQQERVAIVAPIVVGAMNVMETDVLEGEKHSARYDAETRMLEVVERGVEQPILVAQWDGAEWGDRGSNLSQGQVDYFQKEMLPQLERAIGLRREKQGELWIEVG
jgi:hypothetical protein